MARTRKSTRSDSAQQTPLRQRFQFLFRDVSTTTPPGYAAHGLQLVQFQLPGIVRSYVFTADEHGPTVRTKTPISARLAFIQREAERLAFEQVGDAESYVLIHSGRGTRRRPHWHVHVHVLNRRWQKAWIYGVLALKNLGAAVSELLSRQPRDASARKTRRRAGKADLLSQ